MKKRRFYRIIAFILAFCLVLSGSYVPGLAVQNADAKDISSAVIADDGDYEAVSDDKTGDDEEMDDADTVSDNDPGTDEVTDKEAVSDNSVTEVVSEGSLYAFQVRRDWHDNGDFDVAVDKNDKDEPISFTGIDHVPNVSIHDTYIFKFFDGKEWIPINDLDDARITCSEGQLGRKLFVALEGKTIKEDGNEYQVFEFIPDPYDKVKEGYWLAYSPSDIEDQYKLYFDFDMPFFYFYSQPHVSYQYIIDEYQCDVKQLGTIYVLFDDSVGPQKLKELRLRISGDMITGDIIAKDGVITPTQVSEEESFRNRMVEVIPLTGEEPNTFIGFQFIILNPSTDAYINLEGKVEKTGDEDDNFYAGVHISPDIEGFVFTHDYDRDEDGNITLRENAHWSSEEYQTLKKDMEFMMGYRHINDKGDVVVDIVDEPADRFTVYAAYDSEGKPLYGKYYNENLEKLGKGLYRLLPFNRLLTIKIAPISNDRFGEITVDQGFPSTGFYAEENEKSALDEHLLMGNEYTVSENKAAYIFHNENFDWVDSYNFRLYAREAFKDYGENSPGELIYSTFKDDEVSKNANFNVEAFKDEQGHPAYKVTFKDMEDFIDLESVTYWKWKGDPNASDEDNTWEDYNRVQLQRSQNGLYARYYWREDDHGDYTRMYGMSLESRDQIQFADRDGDDYEQYKGELIVKKQNDQGEWTDVDDSYYEMSKRIEPASEPDKGNVFIAHVLHFKHLGRYRVYKAPAKPEDFDPNDFVTFDVNLPRIGFYSGEAASEETFIGRGTAVKDGSVFYMYVNDDGEWNGKSFTRLYVSDPSKFDHETGKEHRELIFSTFAEDKNDVKAFDNLKVERVNKDGKAVPGLYKVTFVKVTGNLDLIASTYSSQEPYSHENNHETWFNTGFEYKNISFEKSSVTVCVGDTFFNPIITEPMGAYFRSDEFTFVSTNEKVAVVDTLSGIIEARSVGKTIIKAIGKEKTIEFELVVKAALEKVELSFEDGNPDILTQSDKTINVKFTPVDFKTQDHFEVRLYDKDGKQVDCEQYHLGWETDELNRKVKIYSGDIEGEFIIEVMVDSLGDDTPESRRARININITKAEVVFEGIDHEPLRLGMGDSLDELGKIDVNKENSRFLGFFNEHNVEIQPWFAYDGTYKKLIAKYQVVIPENMYVKPIGDQVYTGAKLTPQTEIYDGFRWLEPGKDYTVSYKNNVNAGKATVTISGKNNYKGKRVLEFNILPIDLEKADAAILNVDVSMLTKQANNKAQYLAPVLYYNKKKLSVNKDYTLSYPDKSNGAYQKAGVYDVVITGKGNFKGKITLKETLIDKDTVLISKAKFTWTKKVKYKNGDHIDMEDQIKVTYKGKQLKLNEDYYLRYYNDRYPGDTIISVIGINGFAGSKNLNYKIVGSNIAKTVVVSGLENAVYNGDPVWPKIVLKKSKKDNTLLQEGKDFYYEINSNNVDVGKVNVIIYGIGEYEGTTLNKSFSIVPVSVINNKYLSVRVRKWDETQQKDIFIEKDFVAQFDNSGTRLALDVNYKDRYLREGVDYTVKYANNKAVNGAKTPTVTLKFKGNFKDSLTKNFKIENGDLGYMIADSVTYKGTPKKYEPALFVFNSYGNEVKKNKDYKITGYKYLDNGVWKDFNGDMSVLKPDDKGFIDMQVIVEGTGNYNRFRLFENEPAYINYCLIPEERSIGKVKFAVKDQLYSPEGSIRVENNDQITITKAPAGFDASCYRIEEFCPFDLTKKKGTVILVGDRSKGFGGVKKATFKISAKPVDHEVEIGQAP